MTLVGIDVEAVYRALILSADTLRPDDQERLFALWTVDPAQMPAALRAYYADADRADRTPRPLLYVHLGWLAGLLDTEAGR